MSAGMRRLVAKTLRSNDSGRMAAVTTEPLPTPSLSGPPSLVSSEFECLSTKPRQMLISPLPVAGSWSLRKPKLLHACGKRRGRHLDGKVSQGRHRPGRRHRVLL